MKFKYVFAFLSLVVLLSGSFDSIVAQSKVGTTAAPFLTLGTGARGSALGHAYSAAAEGGDALFWNPAGAALGDSKKGEVFLTYHEWFADINYTAAALVLPVGVGRLGLSVAAVDYGRMEITTEQQPEGTGTTFDANDLVVGVSYSRPLTNFFYFGGTVKLVRQTIFDMEAQTGAVDLGFVLKTDFFNGIRISGVISNFGGDMNLDGVNTRIFVQTDPEIRETNQQLPAKIETRDFNLPLQVRGGIYVPVVKKESIEWIIMSDVQQTNDNYINADTGTELLLKTKTATLALRGGYKDFNLDNSYSHWSFGAGVDVNFVQYKISVNAATAEVNDLGWVRMIDLRVGF